MGNLHRIWPWDLRGISAKEIDRDDDFRTKKYCRCGSCHDCQARADPCSAVADGKVRFIDSYGLVRGRSCGRHDRDSGCYKHFDN